MSLATKIAENRRKREPEYRSAFITSFNPESDVEDRKWPERVLAARWQEEKCPETGRLHTHYQIWCSRPISRKMYQKMVDDKTANVQSLKDKTNKAQYTMKEDTRVRGPWSYGEIPEDKQGERTDLEEMIQAVKDGYTYGELVEKFPGTVAKYNNFVKDCLSTFAPKRTRGAIEVIMYYGPGGTGKTTRAVDENPGAFLWSEEGQFTGYDGQDCVIFDEIRPCHFKMTELNRILQPFPVRVKGLYSRPEMLARKFVFCTNVPPTEWYAGLKDVNTFRRRFTHLEEMTEVKDTGKIPAHLARQWGIEDLDL